jgi:hypothetical protein
MEPSVFDFLLLNFDFLNFAFCLFNLYRITAMPARPSGPDVMAIINPIIPKNARSCY